MIERGEIWWADVGPPTGSVPGHRRPVVVISADAFNASRIGTVVVVVLTSNSDRAAAPGNVMIPAEVSGLERDSVINVSQVTTLGKRTLTSRVSRLPFDVLDRLDAGLRLALDLTAWAHGPPERQLVTGDARCDTGDGNSRQGRVKVGEESVNPLKGVEHRTMNR